MKIGIMGGTFNPIHLGHLILSEYIREGLNLDKIIFIPTGQPPHKDNSKVIDALHRKAMTELSIKDNPYFFLSNIELERKYKSYTIDTIKELKEQYKDDTLIMIIGTDSLMSIESWKDSSELLKQIDFIVADRISREKEDTIKEIKRLNLKHSIEIKYLDIPLLEISSTEIRDRVRKNKSIKYLVKENVYKYILENNLYKENLY
ncbi:nicotinate-nucleotide adenylyltransferase [Tissierella creatinophila]|uniref:Probable nicotinate-nucleotide adenylyltransferase n=1 Tax=Tissierella creatinophila DSM 6911 TaxID=1123403 RepID=A0A1U7M800_TISCR|nr:nicotinate-nucleotide adenylyltransferase [Tissierella creatinophila]OLS03339.1 nicotinate-nucleotide adenylyltransferase [Tissierella creatinophila DSM 6911]